MPSLLLVVYRWWFAAKMRFFDLDLSGIRERMAEFLETCGQNRRP